MRLADYGFEYSEEEDQEEDVDIENQYYNSKGRQAEYGKGTRVHQRAARSRMRCADTAHLALHSPCPRTPALQVCWRTMTRGKL